MDDHGRPLGTHSYLDAGEFVDTVLGWGFNLAAVALALCLLGYALQWIENAL